MEKVNFEVWAVKWIEQKRSYIKESTYANYLIMLKNHLIPELGMYAVEDITKELVQTMILKLRTEGRIDKNGGLSDKTVKDMIIILKMCLKDYGIEDVRLFQRNAFQYPVNSHVTGMKILNDDMQFRMLQAIRCEKSYEAIGYAISLFTGMRIGEICALQWKDIDLEHRVIRVTKTLQRIYLKDGQRGRTKVILGAPKSRAAVREIPISRNLEEFLPYNNICNREYYVLTDNSKFVEPRLYRKHFMKFLEKNHFTYMRFHDLRHTFATRCIEKGGDYKTVSCLLGHSSVNLTLNRYVHPQMDQKRECVELL